MAIYHLLLEQITNILPDMIAPYQTLCACGRTIPRPWPPCDTNAMCEYCAQGTHAGAAQTELEFRSTEGERATDGRARDQVRPFGVLDRPVKNQPS